MYPRCEMLFSAIRLRFKIEHSQRVFICILTSVYISRVNICYFSINYDHFPINLTFTFN